MIHLSDLTPEDRDLLRADLRIALTGGLIAAVLMGAVVIVEGNVSAWEARSLLQSAVPTIRTFTSTIMVVSASTLALMLTILGLTSSADRAVKGAHFERIRQIALADVVIFTAATLLLMTLVIPFEGNSDVPNQWYDVIFFVATGVSALIGGIAVSIMLLLYAAVRDLTMTMGPGDETPLFDGEQEEALEDVPAEDGRVSSEA